MRTLLAYLLAFAFASCGTAWAILSDTINRIPSAGANFTRDLQEFDRDEDADRLYETSCQPTFVHSGCLGATAAGLSHTPTACIAYARGYRSTEVGSITYPDAATCVVVLDRNVSGDLTSTNATWTRIAGTHYLRACTADPVLPVDTAPLMTVTTAAGAITAVEDDRHFLDCCCEGEGGGPTTTSTAAASTTSTSTSTSTSTTIGGIAGSLAMAPGFPGTYLYSHQEDTLACIVYQMPATVTGTHLSMEWAGSGTCSQAIYADDDGGALLVSVSAACPNPGVVTDTFAAVTLGAGAQYRFCHCSDGGASYLGVYGAPSNRDMLNEYSVGYGSGANSCLNGVVPATTGALTALGTGSEPWMVFE